MSAHEKDAEILKTRNTARFFTENRHVSWVLLLAVLAWGAFGYVSMPKRKDPDVSPNVAVVMTSWPGTSPDRIEQLITRRVEEKIAENSKIEKIESVSRTGISVVTITLDQKVK